jgi:hypothetical protein
MDVIDGQNPFLHCGIRGYYDVVLVLSHLVLAFGFQDADYPERDFAETDGFADGIFSGGEKILDDGFSKQADLSG